MLGDRSGFYCEFINCSMNGCRGNPPELTVAAGLLPCGSRMAGIGAVEDAFMKVGFSTLACPGWDLEKIVTQAATLGYDGVEIRGLQGELNLPLVPALAARPEHTRAFFEEHKVELHCLGCSATLDAKSRSDLAKQKALLIEHIELAGSLGCPFVRILAGEVQRWDNQRALISRVATALLEVVPAAARHGVTVLIENGGDLRDSEALWFLADAASHPAVHVCWNSFNAALIGERPTISIPRLGRKTAMVHLCDGVFDGGGLVEYVPLGEGTTEIDRQIELLRGIAFDGYLMFEWPKLWVHDLAEADAVLPGAVQTLRELLAREQAVLTAYKGDKRPAKFAAKPPTANA